uniref:hypothetical protein n=1 Tax=Halorientalis salina TaxID=2932266 RepID=UPI00145DFE77|nr:hypothetical protein [Halorientalis salina]
MANSLGVDSVDGYLAGEVRPSTARQYLKRKLAERVGDRQELLIPTGESPFEKASLNHS